MAIPKDKDELLKAIADNYQKLTKELASIPIDLTEKKELDGHSKNTLMSINNLVAYLVGWGQLVLKWNDKKSKYVASGARVYLNLPSLLVPIANVLDHRSSEEDEDLDGEDA